MKTRNILKDVSSVKAQMELVLTRQQVIAAVRRRASSHQQNYCLPSVFLRRFSQRENERQFQPVEGQLVV